MAPPAADPHPALHEAARAFHAAGCSVVPTATDGTKAPDGTWRTYQQRHPTDHELAAWFTGGHHDGFGVVCGHISGRLEMLELEGRAVADGMFTELADLATNSGLGDLWRTLTTGYLEATPSGGFHMLYRLADGPVPGNTKLARRHGDTNPATGRPTIEVLIETRGEGGYVVVAPSAGRTHPTGKPWLRLAGNPATIPTITPEQRQALHDLCRALDQLPHTQAADEPRVPTQRRDGEVLPGEDYNTRSTWADLLEPRGWTRVYTSGRTTYWRRPGKTHGVSATSGRTDTDNLYVFTTSTEFDAEKPYSKFGAYALLEHGGDHSAAARALRRAGYGTNTEPAEPARAAATQLAGIATPDTTTDGNLAVIHDITTATRPALTIVDTTEPDTYSRTDDGNALRLVDTYGDVIRYVPQRGAWLAWTGHRWRWDTGGAINEHARAIARALPETEHADRVHRRGSLSGRGLAAIVRIAQTDPRIVADIDHLDANAYELNTPAGVVDLRTGQLRAPDPTALHTRSTAVAPDHNTSPTRWLRFLADTFAGDPDITTYVQRLLGVSLVGAVLEQVLPFAFGDGANGKTTLLGAVQRIIGLGDDGYAISAPAELLLASTNQGHPTEIARLAGARLVVTSELDEGQRFAEARVKQLTGRDAIAGRFMRQDWFTFTPTHTLWLLANHQPAVRSGGPAFWRRLRLVPFLHVVPPEQRDPHLEDHLVEHEGPAVLAWLIQGAADYFTHGLSEPASVLAATDAYARDQDTVARFVEEMCDTGAAHLQHMRVKVTALRQEYETWCRTEGETPVSAKAFTLALRSRYGVESERRPDSRWYAGIRLRDLDQGPDDPSSDPSSVIDDNRGW